MSDTDSAEPMRWEYLVEHVYPDSGRFHRDGVQSVSPLEADTLTTVVGSNGWELVAVVAGETTAPGMTTPERVHTLYFKRPAP